MTRCLWRLRTPDPGGYSCGRSAAGGPTRPREESFKSWPDDSRRRIGWTGGEDDRCLTRLLFSRPSAARLERRFCSGGAGATSAIVSWLPAPDAVVNLVCGLLGRRQWPRVPIRTADPGSGEPPGGVLGGPRATGMYHALVIGLPAGDNARSHRR